MNVNIVRHFLFLQGMPCDFFKCVGNELEERGHKVSRINLSFADWLFWHDGRAINFRGKRSDWPEFLKKFLQKHSVTDIVLLGEQRKYHKEAVALAQLSGVRIMATDFGYFRPDWITLEPNGMGGESRMPKDAAGIVAQTRNLPSVDFTPQFQDSSWRMSVGDFVGSFGDVIFGFFYPHYIRSVERPHPLIYFPAMGLALLRRKWRAKSVDGIHRKLHDRKYPYFVFPLQLDFDFQIRAYSPYSGMGEAIDQVLISFARYAPQGFDLWIKAHPWDPGLINWKERIRVVAVQWGIESRIHYFDGGNLDEMMNNASGVVTVNSTSGLKALQLGRPVQVLGSAVYDVAGLTYSEGLDKFWSQRLLPDMALLDSFIKLLVHHSQIRGVFFHPKAKRVVVKRYVDRLLDERAA